MPRYLGVDHGSKRIGLAVSDGPGHLALPLKHIDSRGSAERDAEAIRRVVDDYGIDVLVVGLPLNMDGTSGDQAARATRYGTALAAALRLPVEFHDERLSSHAADCLLDQRPELTTGQRRERRDGLAAQTILQDFLDCRRR